MFQGSLLLEEDVSLDDCVVFYTDTRWAECLEEWKGARVWGLDIETWGQNSPQDGLNPWKGSIRLIQVGLPSGRCMVIDLGGIDGCKTPQHILDEFLIVLQTQLKSRYHLTVGQNLKFDLLFILCKFGFEARGTRDIMLMSQLYWAGLKQVRHSLKEIAARLDFGEVDKTEQSSEWWSPNLTNKQINYAAKDALLVIDIFYKLGEMINEAGITKDARVECSALPAFVEMEYTGMPCDLEMLKSNIRQYKDAADAVLKPFLDMFPGVNPNSSQQLIPVLSTYLKKQITSTGQEELIPFKDKPPIAAIINWRSLMKLLEYQENMLSSYFDGAVRGNYRQQSPKGYGRSTCSGDKKSGRGGVNLQNAPASVPRELEPYKLPHPRSSFRSKPGETLLVSDLSSAHARISASMSQSPIMLDSYNKGVDFHAITAANLARIRKMPPEWHIADNIAAWKDDKSHPNQKEAKLLRTTAKPVHYGSLNLQGGNTLKVTVKTEANIDISIKEAREIIKLWRETYKEIYELQLNIIKQSNANSVVIDGKEYGIVQSPTGRRVFMLKMASDFRPNDPPSVKGPDAVSMVWQAVEACAVKLAMAKFLDESDAHPEWNARLCNLAHDEIDALCDTKHELEVATALQLCMRAAFAILLEGMPPDDMDNKPESLIVESWADH